MEASDRGFGVVMVSDATGTTLLGLARACLAQFQSVEPVQKKERAGKSLRD